MSNDPSMTPRSISVAVIQTRVYGVSGYYAECLRCGWRCCRQAHDRQATALRHARTHVCGDLPEGWAAPGR